MRNILLRPVTVSPVVLLGALCAAPAAIAQTCGTGQVATNAGFGPPSISVVESSTAQVLEEVRKRQLASLSQPAGGQQQVAQQQQQPEPEPEPETSPPQQKAQAEKPAGEAQTGEKQEGEKQAEKQPSEPTSSESKPKVAKKKKAAPEPQRYESAEISAPRYRDKGFYASDVDYDRRNAAWGRGFLGWDRHSNLAPGQEENPTRKEVSGGAVFGMDWTTLETSREKAQIGAFGGYFANEAKFSSTFFTPVGTPDTYQRTGNKQTIDGGFVGGYLTYRKDQWLSDLAFKTDIYELSQKSFLTQLTAAGADCGAAAASGDQSGSSSLTSLTFAGNLTDRIPHGEHEWFGPTAGFRYSTTWFGSNVSTTNFNSTTGPQTIVGSLGLDDGQALRLQGGVRYGGLWPARDGSSFEAEVGALLYSDVWIDGFTFTSTSGGFVSPVDEGKVRALGQAMAKFNLGNGWIYMVQGEVFGGEDLFGLDGQLGVRYEW